MKLNVWQATAIANAMTKHDDATKATVAGLDDAYAEVTVHHEGGDENGVVIEIVWESGTRLLLADAYDNEYRPVPKNEED